MCYNFWVKKILHLPNFYPPHKGGIEEVCYQIVVGMKNHFDQKVLCFNDTDKTIQETVDGVELLRVGVWKKFLQQPLTLAYKQELQKILQNWRPDFVHLHLPNPLISIYLLKILPAETKLIIHWHSDIVARAQQIPYLFYRFWERKILARSEKIVVTSPNYLSASQPLQNFLDKAVIIPNMVDEQKLQKREGDEAELMKIKSKYQDRKIILACGRLVEYKGFKYLIHAVKILFAQRQDFVVLVVGNGPLWHKLKTQSKNLPIEFLGSVDNDSLRQLFYSADIFAFSSITRNEAFGISLAEAMYCGLPTVTFEISGSGVNWVSPKNETGLEAQNKDIEDYAHNLDQLLSDDYQRKKIGLAAKKRIEDNFVWDKIAGKVLALYN